MRWPLLSVFVLTACDGGASTPPPTGFDGGSEPIDCATAVELELGRCVSAEGAPCNGTEPSPRWDAMPADGRLAPLVGPQGSTMFALAARARGIDPGDPERPASRDNPVVTLTIDDEAGEEVARLGSRSPLTPSPGLPGIFETAQLFVVVDHLASALAGRQLHAEATIVDRFGEAGCGRLSFSTPP